MSNGWPKYHFWCFYVFLMIFVFLEILGRIHLHSILYLTSSDVDLSIKWSEKLIYVNFAMCWYTVAAIPYIDDSYCVSYWSMFLEWLERSIFRLMLFLGSSEINLSLKWSEKCIFYKFDMCRHRGGHNPTFWWILRCFILIYVSYSD